MTTKANPTTVVNSLRPSLPQGAPGASQARESSFSIDSELRHVSLIVYAASYERVRALVPMEFELEEGEADGRRVAWLSVVSFLDRDEERGSFEQTSYAAHVRRNGEPGTWILGISLGSLGAVATRNLWPLPWHLSAMEIDAAYSPVKGRYAEYGLRTQSEWANASWRIEDSGVPVRMEDLAVLPMSLRLPATTRYFTRRDGMPGGQRVQASPAEFTRGRLRAAKCDLLARLGVLTQEELQHPFLTAVCPSMRIESGAPFVLREASPTLLRRAA